MSAASPSPLNERHWRILQYRVRHDRVSKNFIMRGNLVELVYFVIVAPYTKAKAKYFPDEPEGAPANVALLAEIRDLLKAQNQA